MLLTIGMIVKNEEKYLERCLNGIRPILEQVDSELIIADTGSIDRTVEIARQFTDNVFYFEWIKDFAAARNSTLEKARGEWFMYVDGDEIFESCDEIIRFFNSGEYKKYNSASYIQRNLCNSKEDMRYSDFRAPRMTKILPDTKFAGIIHENLNTYGKPEKLFRDFVIHYGYDNAKSAEESKSKFKRNAELLLKRLENKEYSGMLYLQLYETFIGQEPEKALEYLEEGICYCKKNGLNVLIPLLAKKEVHLYEEQRYEELLMLSEEYFSVTEKMRSGSVVTDMEIECATALTLSKLERHEESIARYKNFFALFDIFQNDELVTADGLMTSRIFADPFNYTAVLISFISSSIEINKISEAYEFLLSLPFENYLLDKHLTEGLAKIVSELLWQTDYKEASEFYERLDEYGKEKFRKSLFSQIFRTESPDTILDFFKDNADCAEFRRPSAMACVIAEAKKNGDYKNCIAEMRKLVEDYPELAPLISDYHKTVMREYEQAQPMTEMQRLAAMIKGNIRNYIALGNIEAAKKTLAEYEKINPGDSEIAGLKEKLK